MNKPFYMDLEGFKEIQARLSKVSPRMKSEVLEEIKDGAQVIARNSQRDASKKATDQGQLARGIRAAKGAGIDYDVLSLAPHSPFIEWGTKKKARVPGKYADYASQFKGLKTGSAKEALFAILAWTKRKGLRFAGKDGKPMTIEQTGYIIYKSIMANGITPRPFLFHNFEAQEPIIIKNIQKVLGELL